MKPTDFAYNLSRYFKSYMPGELGLSSKTIRSYQDAFSIFLKYCKSECGIIPDKLMLDMLNVDLLSDFLQYLEDNGNSIATRNHRLTVLRAFFKYLQLKEPKHILLMQQLLAIKHKKNKKPVINFLSIEGITLITRQPTAQFKSGYRDMLLLSVLYDSAARVDELINIKIGDFRLSAPATVLLHGKGGKDRIVPISQKTADLVQNYLIKEKLKSFEYNTKLLFNNRSGNKLTGAGVTYIVKKYANLARMKNPSLIPNVLSPHCFRHSKAMHLLQSGVSLIYIRDFLGHEHIKTTEIYAKIDSAEKRKAIENAYPNTNCNSNNDFEADWNDDSSLMTWIKYTCS
jgi:integrase/recombinase XerD